MLPSGEYRWELSRDAERVAVEEARLSADGIAATRATLDGLIRQEARAALDANRCVSEITLRYVSAMFRRDAAYRVDGDNLRGNVSAMAGRNDIVIKLGRFRELQAADLTVFRMLILAHVRARSQSLWTGRVAVIDPLSLVATSLKQTCRQQSAEKWLYETRMGEVEEIELDARGVILRGRDSWGGAVRLIVAPPAF